jgi:hypothetical protein
LLQSNEESITMYSFTQLLYLSLVLGCFSFHGCSTFLKMKAFPLKLVSHFENRVTQCTWLCCTSLDSSGLERLPKATIYWRQDFWVWTCEERFQKRMNARMSIILCWCIHWKCEGEKWG